MWTIEVIKARFIEAADIEKRIPVPGGGGTAWPAYYHDEEDRAGWDDQARADALERWQGRKICKSTELTRWEEVIFDWTSLIPDRRRSLVWRWAQCIANGRSFSEYCERKGLVRMTAYNRMERVFKNLVAQFSKEARLLRNPEGKWALQQEAVRASLTHTMERPARKRYAEVHPKDFRSEPSCDTLNNPAAVAAFSQHLADTNDKRRRQREARLKKSLRGVADEADASAA